ncbi:hypothetical protein ElyMa_001644100 [Elysia marginata]|uniref:CID domain-containing protein n=1 Tax=Elysia marginata TaxID=1093978 RepID=A0AAV4JMW6_9GAST|nr:hypothetical protein ElyMa_001644100 [Elysia marginata]
MTQTTSITRNKMVSIQETRKTSLEDNSHSKGVKDDLGMVLAVCLQELVEVRPIDPIDYISQWLYKYANNREYFHGKVLHYQALGEKYAEYQRKRHAQRLSRDRQMAELGLIKTAIRPGESTSSLEAVKLTASIAQLLQQRPTRYSKGHGSSLLRDKLKLNKGSKKGQKPDVLNETRDTRYRRGVRSSSASTFGSSYFSSSYSSTYSDDSRSGESFFSTRSGGSQRSGGKRRHGRDRRHSQRDGKRRDNDDKYFGVYTPEDKKDEHRVRDPRTNQSYHYYTGDQSRTYDRYRDRFDIDSDIDDEYGEERRKHRRRRRSSDTSVEEKHRHHGKERKYRDRKDYDADDQDDDDDDNDLERRHRHHHREHRSDKGKRGKSDRQGASSRRERDYKERDFEKEELRGDSFEELSKPHRRRGQDGMDSDTELDDKDLRRQRSDEYYARKCESHRRREHGGYSGTEIDDRDYRRDRAYDRYPMREERDFRRERRQFDDPQWYSGKEVFDEIEIIRRRELEYEYWYLYGHTAIPLRRDYSYPSGADLRGDFSYDDVRPVASTPSQRRSLWRLSSEMVRKDRRFTKGASTWALSGSPPVLTCYHPVLGRLRPPHRFRVAVERADIFWGRVRYACNTLYDQEIYTVCDPYADDDLYQDRMAKWNGKTWDLDSGRQEKPR